MQPRQIYASTLTRRDRRWTSRRVRGGRVRAIVMVCAVASLSVLALVAPVLI